MHEQDVQIDFDPFDGSAWGPMAFTGRQYREANPVTGWKFNPWTGDERGKWHFDHDPMGWAVAPSEEKQKPTFKCTGCQIPGSAHDEHCNVQTPEQKQETLTIRCRLPFAGWREAVGEVPFGNPLKPAIAAMAALQGIDATLAERGARYGKFTEHARITQSLKDVMQAAPKWSALKPDQKEALEMVAHKIGRILNGDPDYDDSWVDIAGYAKLVADRLRGVER